MITEKVPGPWATMIGGLIMALVGIINEEDASRGDFREIGNFISFNRNDDNSSFSFRDRGFPMVCN